MFSFDEIIQSIMANAGLQELTAEQKQKILTLAQKRLGLWILKELPPEQLAEVNKLYQEKGEAGQQEISAYLKSHITDFEGKVKKELLDLVSEINAAMKP